VIWFVRVDKSLIHLTFGKEKAFHLCASVTFLRQEFGFASKTVFNVVLCFFTEAILIFCYVIIFCLFSVL